MPIRTVARPPAGNVAFAPTTQPTTRGGGRRSFNVRARVGTFNFPSAPGVVDVTGVGFTPRVLIPFGSQTTTDGNTTAVNLGIGAAKRDTAGWNLLQFTEALDNAYWRKIETTITANADIGPFGDSTFDRIVETTANTEHRVDNSAQFPAIAGTTYTVSVFVKAQEVTRIRLGFDNVTNLPGRVIFDLSNGTIALTQNGSGTITPVTGQAGWFRCTVTGTCAVAYNARVEINLVQGNSTSTIYAGNTANGLLAGRVQLVVGSSPLDYEAQKQAAISASSQNAVTTTVTNRRHTNTNVVSMLAGNGTLLKEAAVHSLTSDGFALNFTTASVARIFNHVCLGGDIEANLVQCQMNNTNAAESFAHGLSGAPTAIIVFTAANASAPPSISARLDFSIGSWAGGSQWNGSIYAVNNATTTSTRRRFSTSGVASWLTTATQREMSVASVDATTVNVTYPVQSNSSQVFFWMLCLRNCTARVGTFDLNGLTGPQTISLPGLTPRLFLPVLVPNGVSSLGSVLTGLNMTIGASDGTSTVSSGTSDQNAVTTTNARRWQSSSDLEEYDVNGNKIFDATVSFVGESIVVNPSLNTSGVGQGAYLVIGS